MFWGAEIFTVGVCTDTFTFEATVKIIKDINKVFSNQFQDLWASGDVD